MKKYALRRARIVKEDFAKPREDFNRKLVLKS
jgi:hypothetical protein